jgi:hypothetical protein
MEIRSHYIWNIDTYDLVTINNLNRDVITN